ncbi:MAG: hypothetical protein V2A58_08770 [Planctomycetota bacterium]
MNDAFSSETALVCPERALAGRFGPSLFVWGVWAFTLTLALAYVARYGVNFPTWDEYVFIPQLTGERPITPAWLWSPYNGHRLVLPRLIYIGLVQASGGDFRVGMYGNVLLFGLASFALIAAARRIRGRLWYTDVVFPFALLHLGHASCFLWSILVQFVLSSAVFCLAIACIAEVRREVTCGRAFLIWAMLVALGLSGGNGVVLVPPLGLWLVYLGARRLRSNAPGRLSRGIFLASLGMTVILLAGFYLVGLNAGAERPEAAAGETLLGALAFLGSSLGSIGMLTSTGAVLIGAAVALVAAAVLLTSWIADPDSREVSSGLIMCLASVLLLALAIGWARTGFGKDYIIDARRFATLSAPLLCLGYMTLVRFARRPSGRFLEMVLFTLLCATYAYNVRDGLDHGGLLRDIRTAALRDARAGMSSQDLAQRHYILQDKKLLAEGIEMLRRARYGPFRPTQESGGD